MDDRTKESESDAQYGLSRLLRKTFDLRDGTVGAILQDLLRAARLTLNMEVAFISEFDSSRRVFRYVDQADDAGTIKVGTGDPLDSSYCMKVVQGQLPELIQNAQELDATREMPVTRELGIGAHASVPIRLADGTVYGTFCTFSFHANHSLNERDAALMRVLADIAADLIEKDMRTARERDEKRQRIEHLMKSDALTMVWQPIVEMATGRICGVESLARFPRDPHPTPVGWFDEATSVGLGRELETRAIEKALRVLDSLPPEMYVTCNVSAAAFLEGNVIQLLQTMPLDRIVLEITEHDIVEDYIALSAALAPLRERGLRLAVDDAGAGYASFRHVLRLNPELIKLDMSLTRDIDTDISRRSLAASLLRFADEINSTLIAEGVETRGELDMLVSLGVRIAQGFFLHHPKTLAELQALLASQP